MTSFVSIFWKLGFGDKINKKINFGFVNAVLLNLCTKSLILSLYYILYRTTYRAEFSKETGDNWRFSPQKRHIHACIRIITGGAYLDNVLVFM